MIGVSGWKFSKSAPVTLTLQPAFAGRSADVSEVNIQARVRGNFLMALSNKFGYLVLSTATPLVPTDTDAGFDEVYVGQIGGNAEGFFECYAAEVLPRLRDA